MAQEFTKDSPPHPICARCDVPMWLVEVEHFPDGESHQIYQCKVCEAKLTVPLAQPRPPSGTT